MDRSQVMNLVSDEVHEYLHVYRPPSNESDGHKDPAHADSALSQVSTDDTSQHANSALSDLTIQAMQQQMDMMQTMMTQVCQLISNTSTNNQPPRTRQNRTG